MYKSMCHSTHTHTHTAKGKKAKVAAGTPDNPQEPKAITKLLRTHEKVRLSIVAASTGNDFVDVIDSDESWGWDGGNRVMVNWSFRSRIAKP